MVPVALDMTNQWEAGGMTCITTSTIDVSGHYHSILLLFFNMSKVLSSLASVINYNRGLK